jgi:acyl-CoA synthetase (AMP-forming)/AMP-acid ligase II
MSIHDDHLERTPVNHLPLSPISFLERSALAYPDKTAVIDGDRRLDYRSLFSRCLSFADLLRRRGVGRDPAGDDFPLRILFNNSLAMRRLRHMLRSTTPTHVPLARMRG